MSHGRHECAHGGSGRTNIATEMSTPHAPLSAITPITPPLKDKEPITKEGARGRGDADADDADVADVMWTLDVMLCV